MPKIQRETQKIFCNSADSDQIAVFGSMATGTPVYSNDIDELQSNEAFELGWDAATLEDKAPFMEEMNGVQYAITKQLAYNFQEGVPEYDAGTTYYIGSIVKVLEENKPVLYTSLTDDNLGNNPVTDSTNWEKLSFGGGGLEIGDIGIAPLGIDETKGKRRYLNGQLIIQEQYVQFTNKVKSAVALYPSLACTESEWQTTATMTVGGQVGKFVVDDEAGTIRLPKIIMPIQGLTDLSKLAEIVEAGLPNITGQIKYLIVGEDKAITSSGAFTTEKVTESGAWGFENDGTADCYLTKINASRSSSVYGKSSTVQQEQIQYPYFIQVATGAETEDNITNTIELNNPFALLDYKYSEYELNNLSWLRSEGQFNTKIVYPAVYDLLLKIYNGTETKAGVSVKLSTETFTDYDFVLNTAEETFMLPTKVKLASGKAVVGNGIALGVTDGSQNASIARGTGSVTSLGLFTNSYGQAVGTSSSTTTSATGKSIGVTTDPTNSGIETSDSGLYLYFYVGETVQNANLINAGRIEESLANKVDKNTMVEVQCVVETYKNGTSWYRVWSDGWCEQGGAVTPSANGATTITLLKSYSNVDYSVDCSTLQASSATTKELSSQNIQIWSKAKGSFITYGLSGITKLWKACGYTN